MHELPPDPNDFKSSMDIFALGCVIAELFMERPLFDFAHLLAYRERKYDPSAELAAEIGDKHILEMVTSMLKLNPNELGAYINKGNLLKQYLRDFSGAIECFNTVT